MYAGSSISVAAIVEHLLNMARDLEDLAHLAWRLSSQSPEAEVLEKTYRQEVVTKKDKIEEMKSKLFEYMASGRIEVVEHSSFYLTIAISLERAAQSLDAAIYRMLLFTSIAKSQGAEALAQVSGLFSSMREALNHLSSALRVVQNMSGANRDQYKMLDQRVARVKVAEDDADKLYRKVMAYALEMYRGDCSLLVALKDLADSAENAMDYIAEAGDYVRALGVSIYSR
ncbi:MAG: hypothetical protein F7B18_08110 [Desulfurococcales archaeon]|nr:hypothetical protein [Desulfurococcales archaeon]